MPLAHIYMLEGRSAEQKREVIERVTSALSDAVGAPIETIRVVILEVPKDAWGIGGVTAKDLGR